MKNKILLITSLLFINVSLSADIIDSIAIVRPDTGEKASETYNSVANWLENSRNETLAETFRSKSENSGFGSGFLVNGDDGHLYIITNFHVMAQSNSASIEFQDHEGNSSIIENCPVVLADENRDLAILLIDPTSTEIELKGLSLNSDLQVEGVDVWTAGFPAFGDEPLWQLAKGSVTNRKARTSELNVNGLAYVIQHSAIIDSGSSGGPLLFENPDVKGLYSVVGVNTWSARGRDNTYFSIPAIDLIDFIGDASRSLNSESDSETLKASLKETSEQFARAYSSAEDDYESHRVYFSHELILEKGWGSYQTIRKTLNDSDREDLDDYFFHISTFKAMKESYYRDVRIPFADEKEIRNIHVEQQGEVFIDDTGVSASVTFSGNNIEAESTWILEQGLWRILNLDIEISEIEKSDKEELKNEGILRNLKGDMSLGITPGLLLSYFDNLYDEQNDPVISGGLNLDLEYYSYKIFGWKIGGGLYKAGNLLFEINGGLVFLLPLSLSGGDVYLTPRLSATVGLALDLDSFGNWTNSFLLLNTSAGIEMSTGKFKENFSLGLEFTYTRYAFFTSSPLDDNSGVTLEGLKPSIYLRYYF